MTGCFKNFVAYFAKLGEKSSPIKKGCKIPTSKCFSNQKIPTSKQLEKLKISSSNPLSKTFYKVKNLLFFKVSPKFAQNLGYFFRKKIVDRSEKSPIRKIWPNLVTLSGSSIDDVFVCLFVRLTEEQKEVIREFALLEKNTPGTIEGLEEIRCQCYKHLQFCFATFLALFLYFLRFLV